MSDGVNMDIDARGNLVGFDIDRVSNHHRAAGPTEIPISFGPGA